MFVAYCIIKLSFLDNIYCINTISLFRGAKPPFPQAVAAVDMTSVATSGLSRRTNWNMISANFCFQKRMNIKKHAAQMPKKYMWAVQLSRLHIFMQPLGRLGRTFLYNHFLFGNDNSTCCSTTTVSVVGGICQ